MTQITSTATISIPESFLVWLVPLMKQKTERLRKELAEVEEIIHILQTAKPETKIETKPPKRYIAPPRKGSWRQKIDEVLRNAEGPLPHYEIAQRIMLNYPDLKMSMEFVRKSISPVISAYSMGENPQWQRGRTADLRHLTYFIKKDESAKQMSIL